MGLSTYFNRSSLKPHDYIASASYVESLHFQLQLFVMNNLRVMFML